MISQRKTTDIYALESYETHRFINQCLKVDKPEEKIVSVMKQVTKFLKRNYCTIIFNGTDSSNRKIRINTERATIIAKKIEQVMQEKKIPVYNIDLAIPHIRNNKSLSALYKAKILLRNINTNP